MSQTMDPGLLLRLEASLVKFERQMARARKVGSSTVRGLQKEFDRNNRKMAESSLRAGNALTRMTQMTGASRFVLQNTANQVGDIAVQLQSGTGAARAFGQQLPQLLGGFGALGGTLGVVAPLLGTVAALGIPIAAAFLAMGRDATSAAEMMEQTAEALEEVRRQTSALESGVNELRTLEERLAAAIVLRGQDQTAVSESVVRAIRAEYEARKAALELQQIQTRRSIEEARARVAALQAEWDQVIANLEEYRAQLERNIARDPFRTEAQVAEMRRLFDEQMAAELAGHEERRANLEAEKAELAAKVALWDATNEAMERGSATMSDLVATLENADMSGLVEQARRLTEEFGLTAEAASEVLGLIGAASDRAGGEMTGAFDPPVAVLRRRAPVRRRSSRVGGGSGGGAPAEMSEAMRAAASIIREVESAAVGFAEVQAELNRMMAEGAIGVDQYNAALELARARYTEVGEAAQFWDRQNQAMKTGILDAIVRGENLADTFRNLAQAIARAALEAALFGSGPLSGSGGGGLLSGLMSGILSFEGGGHIPSAPRVGGVDGRGGIPAILHPGETVIDHKRGGAGGASARVTIEVLPSGEFDARVVSASQPMMVEVVRANNARIPAMMADAQRRAG